VSVTAWRIVKRKKPPRKAFDGEGARIYGGRWNSKGTPMVYTAGSQSLAALEMLVHLDTADLMGQYVFFEVTMEESLIRELAEADLPLDWRSDPPPANLPRMGDAWVASAVSAVLCVPSAIVPAERNFVLNPKHADFAKLRLGEAVPFRYDARLAGLKKKA
jgi:RES domain-containing protein